VGWSNHARKRRDLMAWCLNWLKRKPFRLCNQHLFEMVAFVNSVPILPGLLSLRNWWHCFS
jgi:hypothetical protein